jgi:predicted amidohydrolase YtcJ
VVPPPPPLPKDDLVADADLVLINGRIRTLDPARPSASAIAIQQGTIVAVGDNPTARAALPHAEVIDLQGAAAVPGLTDSHTHALPGGLSPSGIDLQAATTLTELQAALADAAAELPANAWVQGWGVSHDVFEGAGIHGELLDRAAGGRPVLLTFYDLHTALASPRALALAGITGPRHFDEGAEIVCDAHGTPTGELREPAAMRIARAAVPAASRDARLAEAAANLRAFAAAGITSTHVMDGNADTFELVDDLEARDEVCVRLILPAWLTPDIPRDAWPELAALGTRSGARWRGGVAKFFIDGVIESGTAWLLEPDTQGGGTSPFWPDVEVYREAVRTFAAAGHQIVTHAIGDRAVRETLDTYLTAQRAPGIRHRIEHAELVHPDDLPRFAAERVIASLQPQHAMWVTPEPTDPWSLRVRDGRPGHVFPMRDLLESGAHLTFGSDWPVAPLDPRLGMAEAQLRRHPGADDATRLDDQGLSPLQALLGYTLWPAQAVGHDRQGVLTEGAWGDVTVFADDPVEVPADDLPHTPVLLTVVGGEVTYRAEG